MGLTYYMCVHRIDGPVEFWGDNKYCGGRSGNPSYADFRRVTTEATLFCSLDLAREAIARAYRRTNEFGESYQAQRRAWFDEITLLRGQSA